MSVKAHTCGLVAIVLAALSAPVLAQQSDFDLYHHQSGENLHDGFGHSVSGVDDIDGDGHPDYRVGAPYSDPNGIYAAGSAYLYSGLTGALISQWDGVNDSEWFGYRVAGVGDISGDGTPDFLIGALGASPNGVHQAGSVYLYSGATGLEITRLHGTAPMQAFGHSLAGIGDVNHDGIDDFAIGSPRADINGLTQAGLVEVYSGSTLVPLYQLQGEQSLDSFGACAASAGDVNRDGIEDVIVGAPFADPNGFIGAGSAYLFSGVDGGLLQVLHGQTDGVEFGCSVSTVRDINLDGHDDFIIGARRAQRLSWIEGAGAAYVYSGANYEPLLNYTGEAGDEFLGTSVASAGDVNGDDFPDFIIGVPNLWNVSINLLGGALICSGATGAVLYTARSDFGIEGLGTTVAGLGDVNGDGRDDVIVGGPLPNYLGTSSGDTLIYSIRPSLSVSGNEISAANGGDFTQLTAIPSKSHLAGFFPVGLMERSGICPTGKSSKFRRS